ncbi:MAG: class I SAM-dependent methyltransferase [Limnothrix sp. RL_2_0]|nr:class I SAM-dependent methyltransferase [Limnothrix sp. RL_2_0]
MLAQENSFKQKVKKSIYAPEYTDKRYVEEYLNFHQERFSRTENLIKEIIKPIDKVVDLGTYGCLVPVFKDIFGLSDIVCTLDSQENESAHESTILHNALKGEEYPFIRDRFNLESHFPYLNDTFDVVTFTEVLEHLTVDPMYTMSEINRISKTGAHLVLSTPNCASSFSFYKILRGQNPFTFPAFIKGRSTDRHNREYTYNEVKTFSRDSRLQNFIY